MDHYFTYWLEKQVYYRYSQSLAAIVPCYCLQYSRRSYNPKTIARTGSACIRNLSNWLNKNFEYQIQELWFIATYFAWIDFVLNWLLCTFCVTSWKFTLTPINTAGFQAGRFILAEKQPFFCPCLASRRSIFLIKRWTKEQSIVFAKVEILHDLFGTLELSDFSPPHSFHHSCERATRVGLPILIDLFRLAFAA